jgi:hypothetical protein
MINDQTSHLSRFSGQPAAVAEYIAFDSILRIEAQDAEGRYWIISFWRCQEIQFVPAWTMGELHCEIQSPNEILCEDNGNGFKVRYSKLFVIPLAEYSPSAGGV